jgi:hypothetical protein
MAAIESPCPVMPLKRTSPLLTRFERRLQRATPAEGELPLDDVDQAVQLHQVEVVDAQPI